MDNIFYEDLKKMLRSRTLLTLLVIFALNAVNTFGHYLSPEVALFINACLTGAAGYFRINTKIKF